jgi:hypothetical protein
VDVEVTDRRKYVSYIEEDVEEFGQSELQRKENVGCDAVCGKSVCFPTNVENLTHDE